MTYLRVENEYYNVDHIVKVDHVAEPMTSGEPYTRLHFVGLSSTLVITGIKDIESFISAMADWKHSVLDVESFTS